MKIVYLFAFIYSGIFSPPHSGMAKDDLVEKTNKVETYYEENYHELIYIHTDKEYYLAGEHMKFKVYCLERFTSKPSQLSKVAYIEVLNDENTPKFQAKVEIKNGSGYGEIYIPTSINSGNFIVRGYTRWMRNYGPESYFHSIMTIINPFKKLGLDPIPLEEDIAVNFYPESGNIINKVKTKVVFECKNSDDDPISISGKLYANDTILITEIETLKQGIGNFTFIPDIVNTYHIELALSDGFSSKHKLPATKTKGFSMQLEDSDSKYSIDLYCNDPTIVDPSEILYFILRQNGIILDNRNIQLNKGQSSFTIDKSILKDGISAIAIFDSEGKLLTERQVFQYNNNHENPVLKVNKSSLTTREMVTLDISSLSDKSASEDIDFSVSVASHKQSFDQHNLDITQYLLLDNSLNYIHDLGRIFEGSKSEVTQTINNLLIAYPRNENLWQSITQNSTIKYIPEYRGALITANITEKSTKNPGKAITTYLSIPGKNVQFYSSRSKLDGTLVFELRDFYGSNEIILQNDYTKDTTYSIELDNPFSQHYLNIHVPKFNIDEKLGDWIAHQSQNMQIQNAYMKFEPKQPVLTQIDTNSFYNEPNSRYYLDDFTRFIVMEEVMREYVTGVNVRKNKNGFHFMVLDIERNLLYKENPLMLLDGVPVFDADEIIALDPLKVEKIETIKGKFHKGTLECKGIVSYTTYEGDLDGYSLNKNALVIEYEGVQARKTYFSPTYSSAFDKRIKTPDFRNTLYWNPQVLPNKEENSKLVFYTSDDANTYEIRVEGINSDGKAFSGKTFIEVK